MAAAAVPGETSTGRPAQVLGPSTGPSRSQPKNSADAMCECKSPSTPNTPRREAASSAISASTLITDCNVILLAPVGRAEVPGTEMPRPACAGGALGG